MSNIAEVGDTAINTLSLSPMSAAKAFGIDLADNSDVDNQNEDSDVTVSANIEGIDAPSADTGANAALGVPDTDYSAMTVAELKDLARSKGLTGYSTMNKSELIELLSAN